MLTTSLWNSYYYPCFTDKSSHYLKADTDLKTNNLWDSWCLFLVPSTLSYLVSLKKREVSRIQLMMLCPILAMHYVGFGVGFLFSGSDLGQDNFPKAMEESEQRLRESYQRSSVEVKQQNWPEMDFPVSQLGLCLLCQSIFCYLPLSWRARFFLTYSRLSVQLLLSAVSGVCILLAWQYLIKIHIVVLSEGRGD